MLVSAARQAPVETATSGFRVSRGCEGCTPSSYPGRSESLGTVPGSPRWQPEPTGSPARRGPARLQDPWAQALLCPR